MIGGTSLFGGRGSACSALLGIIVIQSIASGLTLPAALPVGEIPARASGSARAGHDPARGSAASRDARPHLRSRVAAPAHAGTIRSSAATPKKATGSPAAWAAKPIPAGPARMPA